MAWDLRWKTYPCERIKYYPKKQKVFSQPGVHKQTVLRKKNIYFLKKKKKISDGFLKNRHL
jgi:hypothetical protein